MLAVAFEQPASIAVALGGLHALRLEGPNQCSNAGLYLVLLIGSLRSSSEGFERSCNQLCLQQQTFMFEHEFFGQCGRSQADVSAAKSLLIGVRVRLWGHRKKTLHHLTRLMYVKLQGPRSTRLLVLVHLVL